MKFLIFLALFFQLNQNVMASSGEQIRYMPVQHAGRIKPFDTFAKETLELIYGKKSYKGAESAQSIEAHWVILTWLLSPESWMERPLFEIKHHDLLEKLNLSKERKHFTIGEILKSENFQNLMQELQNRRDAKEKLNPFFQAVQRVENQIMVFREITAGGLVRIYPIKESETWLAPIEFSEKIQPYFIEISKNLASYLGLKVDPKSTAEQIKSAGEQLDKSVLAFEEQALQSAPEKYESSQKVKREVFYNDFHPFRWAYIAYLLASLILLYLWIRNQKGGMKLAWFFVIVGFALHIFGFAYRIYLAERPPVSNMYETVVWTSWGAVLFAIILEAIYKFKVLLLGGSLMGLFALIVADSAPAILDPSLQPLEAVLRSNYWLIVHVMTITISYAAFLLAFGLGNMGLIYYVIDEKKNDEKIKMIITGVYRAMQIGVAFLAPGIILGGIWADYSWGRFWGWDPKETWALIVLLGYIVVLHARLVGWLKNFGTLVAGVLTFSLVVMAWYGVNYVLGAGLHSYGFGAGGVEYVSVFIGLQFLFVAYSYIIHRQQKLSSKKQ